MARRIKQVPGTIVRRLIVEETAYATDAYCDECLGEQKLRERPETPAINDEYDTVVPREEVLDKMRHAIPGVVRSDGIRNEIVGYRCSGCDRRLNLDRDLDGATLPKN